MLVCDICLTHKFAKQTLDARLSPFQVSWQEMAVLMAAHRSPDVTCAPLSTLLHTDKGNVTKLLNSMEDKGLITRSPMLDDHRRKSLHLAPAGESLLPDLYRVMRGWESECLDGLSPEDQESYVRMSGMIISNLMRMNEESRGPAANTED